MDSMVKPWNDGAGDLAPSPPPPSARLQGHVVLHLVGRDLCRDREVAVVDPAVDLVGKVGVVGWRPLRVPSRGKGCEQEEDEEEGASERACVRVGACVRATDSLDQGGDDVVVPIVRGSVQCCVARMVLRLHIRLASPSWSLEKGATQPT